MQKKDNILSSAPVVDLSRQDTPGCRSEMYIKTDFENMMIAAVLVFLGAVCSSEGRLIYVDHDAPGNNDGSNWADAYQDLQHALVDAYLSEKPVQIRVARGTYRPDWDTDDREEAFALQDGVAIKGSYAGFGESNPDERDIYLYETILSGDLNEDDVGVAEPCDLLTESTRAENSYHVLTADGTDETAVLDGVTIACGNANGSGMHSRGGGMFISGAPLLINCRFRYNAAANMGGAIGAFDALGSVAVVGCEFAKNRAMYGGAIGCEESRATLAGCIFVENSAYYGGAMSNCCGSLSALYECTLTGNSAYESGGAIANEWSTLRLTNCILNRNTAVYDGGGVMNDAANDWDELTLRNCTLAANTAAAGNALACFRSYTEERSTIMLMNCILWDGGEEVRNSDGSWIKISYCNIGGGQVAVYDPCGSVFWGGGNIEADPCFADFENEDFHLKSQGGRWETGAGTWFQDDFTSPCVDAGNPLDPIGPEPFPNGGIINIGAYGGTTQASKSYFDKPLCRIIVAGDINGDCAVDFLDLGLMTANWLIESSP